LFGWVMLIIVIPMVLDTIVKYNANSIQSVYEMEYEKWNILNDFQIKHDKEVGALKPGEIPTKNTTDRVQVFFKNEFKYMMEKDAKMIDDMEINVSLFHWLSSVFPTSNYESTSYELSGNGYDGLISFYRYALEMKKELVGTFVEIVFVQGKGNDEFEPVLKDGENLFPLKTRIPIAAALGVLLTLIYSATLLGFGNKGYKKELFRLPEKQDYHFAGQKHTIGKNKLWPFTVQGDIFGRQMYNIFSGRIDEIEKKGYDLTFTFEPKGLVTKSKKSDFLYLSHIKKIPGFFKVGAFVSLLMRLARTGKERKEEIISKYDLKPLWKKSFSALKGTEPGRVFMAMLHVRDFEIYLIDDAIDEMPLAFAKELKEGLAELAEKSKAMVIFTTDENYLEKRKKQHGHYYNLSHIWLQRLDELAKLKTRIVDSDS